MTIEELILKNNGYLRTELIEKNGFQKDAVYAWLGKHPEIKRCGHGLYYDSSKTALDCEYALSYHKDDLVFSHETALWLHGFLDERPRIMTVTLPVGYNTRYMAGRNDVDVYTFRRDIYPAGAGVVNTQQGHSVRCYTPERAVCDVVRSIKHEKSNLLTPTKLLGRYFEQTGEKEIREMLSYAKLLSVETEMKILTRLLYC